VVDEDARQDAGEIPTPQGSLEAGRRTYPVRQKLAASDHPGLQPEQPVNAAPALVVRRVDYPRCGPLPHLWRSPVRSFVAPGTSELRVRSPPPHNRSIASPV